MNDKPVNPVDNYRKAAEKGFPEAQFEYGKCLRDGKGVPVNLQAAAEWFLKAAKAGYPGAPQALSILQRPDALAPQIPNTTPPSVNPPAKGSIWGLITKPYWAMVDYINVGK